VKTIILNDVSYFDCGEEKPVNLFTHSILLYGKTWYERRFNAACVDKKLLKNIEKAKLFLASKPARGVFPFHESGFDSWHSYFKTKPCDFFLQHQKVIEDTLNIDGLLYSVWKIKTSFIRDFALNIDMKKNKKKQRNGGESKARQVTRFHKKQNLTADYELI